MTKNPFERNSWGHEIWDDATKTLRANTKLWAEIEIMGAKLEKAEGALRKIYEYRSDEPDWNMIMAIAGDVVNPMEAVMSGTATEKKCTCPSSFYGPNYYCPIHGR